MSQRSTTDLIEPTVEIRHIRKHWLLAVVPAMRPHQWVKNLFIFAPLLFARKLADPQAIGYAFLAFIVFCFLASGLYLFNDWLDIEEDREHPEKRYRPLASGQLPVPAALVASLLLIAGALALASLVSGRFLLVTSAYFALTLGYCLVLKRIMILDCMTIAGGFVLRVVGGAVAISVVATHWLVVCAFLLALFLAFSKRRQELLQLSGDAGKHRTVLNQYTVTYISHVNIALIAAAIVCYALYTVAPETVDRFGTNNLIYGTVFVIYGLFRYTALVENPLNGGNPSRMLLKDLPLLLTVTGWAAYNAIIIYHVAQ
jgi:4-hydroxybenzoate polyprenyltransferase